MNIRPKLRQLYPHIKFVKVLMLQADLYLVLESFYSWTTHVVSGEPHRNVVPVFIVTCVFHRPSYTGGRKNLISGDVDNCRLGSSDAANLSCRWSRSQLRKVVNLVLLQAPHMQTHVG